MRVVVLGGYGNFGARICRALKGDHNIEVLAAARNPRPSLFESSVQSAKLDTDSPGFAAELRAVSPALVIHCAGPFQGQDYRVAKAALAAGAHYLDLADGREFVSGFAAALNEDAKAAGLFMASGASTVPALSSAVVDALLPRFRQIDEIRISIAPGQRAPRGEATIAAVFSYAGKSFKWLRNGRWRDAWGWQEIERIEFSGFGTRWAAACDVPDLELFPLRYPGVRTVEFRAALELGIQHAALWVAAATRRLGLPLPMERAAKPLNRMASFLDRFGGKWGGMLVSVKGTGTDGKDLVAEWHLKADAIHGPEIPCMAAILLARKLANAEMETKGAYPCMGFLSMAEFDAEFSNWRISTITRAGSP